MIDVRTASLAALLPIGGLTAAACTIKSNNDTDGVRPPPQTADAGDAADGGPGDGGEADAGSDAGDENPDPTRFLPIPADENVIRAVVNGGDWAPYDRTCLGLNDADSHHSVGFGDSYIQPSDACADKHGSFALFKVYRAAGLAAGVYDITPDGDVRSKAGLTPPDRPSAESDLTGRLWIRSVTVNDTDTVLEASYYGTAEWPTSIADATPAEVAVQVALKARLRNTDVP